MHSGAVLYADYGKNTEKILKNCLGGREPSEDRVIRAQRVHGLELLIG